MVAEVIVELKAKNIDQTFSYKIPSCMNVKVGMRVLVPFGKQELEGFVLNITDVLPDYELKDILEVVDEEPVLNDELLQLGRYISKKTLSTTISAYQTMLPSALKAKNHFVVPKKYVSYVSLNMPYLDAMSFCKNEKQKEIIMLLKNGRVKKELVTSSSLTTLVKNGIVVLEKEETYRISKHSSTKAKLVLTGEQKSVCDKVLKEKHFRPFLLHGITGSGKTEVYMELIEEKIKSGKTAILLVPEISLTPQVTEKFYHRFGDGIAILHSSLSNGEKYDEWRKIEKGEVHIVIGARSAIFAPLPNLGIIVIDEEHSSTYKQENTPKYHASDIALYRAKYHDIPVVFGSATPSIESYTKAKIGTYELLELKNRVNATLPTVTLVDMKEEIKLGNSVLSSLLKEKLESTISEGKQAIILLNKRGYTRVVTCPNCGYQDMCPYCDIPLTYHKSSNTMRCHYCGYGKSKMLICPECKNTDFRETGMGTEKLEEYIKEHVKGSRILRMDVDTTSKKGEHERIIKAFEEHQANVLVGTQMIAKGLDFKDVTLVGVLAGDSGLNIPDFRSSERTYQLLSQVAGRSGRSETGEVIIQGFNMDHYSIQYAACHDYASFYKKEMEIRRTLKYSPYYNLSLIKLKGKDMNFLFQEGYKIVDYLKSKNIDDFYILGPSTSTIPKINNIFSIQILLKYKNTNMVYPVLKEIYQMYQKNKVLVDIDLSPLQI